MKRRRTDEELFMDEILDLVDETDHVIGNCSRFAIYEKGLTNFRVINGFLRNSKGQIWIPRRTQHKKLFPCHLDVSVGGHVRSGEEYCEAFVRELDEELNMRAHECPFHEVGYFNPHEHRVSAFMKVYEILTDESPEYNQDDFIGAEWLFPQEVIDRLESGDKGKSDLLKLIKLVYGASAKTLS